MIRFGNLGSHRAAALGLGLLLATGCAAVDSPSFAQNTNTNIPVLIVAEDEDKGSINHCNDVHKRVLAELNGMMQRDGFRMIDEESSRAELNWESSCKPPYDDEDRRSKHTLVSDIKRMISARQAAVPVRAWVLYRIHAQRIPYGSGYDAQVRIVGEIYDAVSNQFLDNFQAERVRFPLPDNCNKPCIYELAGDRASDIAANLGRVLSIKLQRYSPGTSQTGSNESGPVTGNTGSGSCGTLLTPFNVTIRQFDRIEAASIAGVMADEFPCYHSHELLEGGEVVRRYAYNTKAKSLKLEEWLVILLDDMGYGTRDYSIQITGNNIVLTKLLPTPNRPRSSEEKARFN